MVKKTKVDLNSIQEIETKVSELKLELARYKGMLASKTKTNNTTKKSLIKKDIARLLTKKNDLAKEELKNKVEGKIKL
jgi:ribosomal protein L29